MEYCKRCLYPANHPLYLILDEEGICSGCRVHEEKDRLDWVAREQILIKILSLYKDRPGSSFDCIIPVTGDGDSFFVVDQMKYKYGLNPLLVSYNRHYNTKVGIRNLARLITKTDCDHMMFTVSPKTVKQITRRTLDKIGDMYWHCTAGIQAFAVTVSKRLNIPLIVWPVNGWLDQVGQFSHEDSVEMSKKTWKEHSLRTLGPEKLVDQAGGLTAQIMQVFEYPKDDELEQARTRGIYLGNFIRWDAQEQIERMIEKYGYETDGEERTFNRYETIGCHHNAGLHDYIKFLKFGYGKATDHASRDIRLRRFTREDGAEFVKRYEQLKPKDMQLFLDWIDMTEEELMYCINKHRDPAAWEKSETGEWILKDSVVNHLVDEGVEHARLDGPLDRRDYIQTDLLEPSGKDDAYLLMGRTYMDEANFRAEG